MNVKMRDTLARAIREIEELPAVTSVKSCVVTSMSFERGTRRAQVVVAAKENCAASVRVVLAQFGVQPGWATVEVG